MDAARRWLLTRLPLLMMAAPQRAESQPTEKAYRVGWLSIGSDDDRVQGRAIFLDALRQLGYRAEQITLVERFAKGNAEQLRAFAVDLVALRVDVIATQGTPAALAAKRATSAIPIVIIGPGDPVGSGLVSSLARPGNNVTGVSAAFRDIAVKCVEVLRDAVPGMSRLAFLGNAANVVNRLSFSNAQAAARSLGIAIEYFSATSPAEIGRALAAIGAARAQGVIVSADAVIVSGSQEIVEFMARARLPAVYFSDYAVELGGLMSYGPSWRDLFRRAAGYVDKILKGARPATLPIEQPTMFDLIINLKVARAVGLTIPPSLLLRANRVIE
jgi:putative ABC transport system substrate-binding protein